MFPFSYIIIFHYLSFYWLLLSVPFSKSLLRFDHISINDYFVGSSKIYRKPIKSKVHKRDVLVTETPEFLFDLQLYNDGRIFPVYLRQRNIDVLANNTVFINKILNNSFQSFSLNKPYLYEGFIEDNPNNSSVSGYIKGDNFYGHLIVNDTFYYIDELKEWDLDLRDGTIAERNALIFKKDSVTMGLVLGQTKSADVLFRELLKQNFYHTRFKAWKQNGRLCPMVIVIDNSFLKIVHQLNIEAAIFHVLFSLEEANAIFRSTDFDDDGQPDNIGFYVKKMIVLTTDEPVSYIPQYTPDILKVGDYLVKFMRFDELPNYCLGMVFTAQKFDRATLGASYTPDSTSLHPISGICDPFILNFGTMNGLVITASTFRTPLVNQMIFEVTITHELGHSFGSVHDTDARCFGYVMSPKSFVDYYSNRTHMIFSPCSREHMLRMLVLKGDCFEHVQTPFCGNGLVEDGEDCDCGLTIDCLQKDPCCVPRRTKEYPCKINRKKGFECHPSQGECCTRDCKFSNHLEKFVNCRNFDRTCPCATGNCSCGLNGMCSNEKCNSIECVRLGLKECQCNKSKLTDKICQVCCEYENKCVTAIEATNLAINKQMTIKTIATSEDFFYKSKQLVSKKFCYGNQCISLSFFKANIGNYCLYKGKLGKCQSNLKCDVFPSRQSFPYFKSASMTKTLNVIHIVFYVVLNVFLIYSF